MSMLYYPDFKINVPDQPEYLWKPLYQEAVMKSEIQ